MKKETIALKEVAKQLSCPTGKEGIEMGSLLDKSNRGMIKESIHALQIHDKNRVLELGHASCKHLKELLKQAQELKFFGMEISEVMRDEAIKINQTYIRKRKALFQLYDGYKISYVSNFFHRILTVNTIYFIEKPLLFLNEMYRVLQPEGKFVIAFATKKFMKKLPFVINNSSFKLYDKESITLLIEKTDFIIDEIIEKKEKIVSKTGDLVEREYLIINLCKKRENKEEI